MSNMSYCRFQNTLSDLRECYDNLHDVLGDDEARARQKLLRVCFDIMSECSNVDIDCRGNPMVEEYDDESAT
jgi:hypothetical protein